LDPPFSGFRNTDDFIIPNRRKMMKPYFEKMPDFGKPLTEQMIKKTEESVQKIK
jgi:hypothetical protein